MAGSTQLYQSLTYFGPNTPEITHDLTQPPAYAVAMMSGTDYQAIETREIDGHCVQRIRRSPGCERFDINSSVKVADSSLVRDVR